MTTKKIFVVISITILLITAYFIATFHFKKPENSVCFSNSLCIQTEIAETLVKRQQGLMFRKNLPENKGMFFIFETANIYSFWMKNTYIPLDIIWIDENFNIVHIENANPCTEETCELYKPNKPAKYVLEVNYNFTKDNNINIGDKIDIYNLK